MSELEAYFAYATKMQDDSPEAWRARAQQEGAQVWRYKRNPVTRRLAEILQQDTGIGIQTPAGKELWQIAGQLLSDYHGDLELLLESLENARRDTRWLDLSPWVQRKIIGVQASRLLTRRERGNAAAEDFYDGEVPEWA